MHRRAEAIQQVGISSRASDAKQAATALDAGLKAHASGDLTTATADYNKTLKYDAKNKFALYNLALIDEAAGNYGLAASEVPHRAGFLPLRARSLQRRHPALQPHPIRSPVS